MWRSIGEDQFQSVGSPHLLARESGHYLADFLESERIFASLNMPSNVLRDHETSADLIGAALAVPIEVGAPYWKWLGKVVPAHLPRRAFGISSERPSKNSCTAMVWHSGNGASTRAAECKRP